MPFLRRAGAGAAATLIALVAAAVAVLYILLIAFACGATDTSSPPPPGSIGDTLCGTPIWAACLPLALLAVAGPFIGISRAAAGRGNGVAIAFAISAGAITAIALVGQLVLGGSWDGKLFVGLPVTLFVVSLLIAIVSPPRREDARLTPERRPRP